MENSVLTKKQEEVAYFDTQIRKKVAKIEEITSNLSKGNQPITDDQIKEILAETTALKELTRQRNMTQYAIVVIEAALK